MFNLKCPLVIFFLFLCLPFAESVNTRVACNKRNVENRMESNHKKLVNSRWACLILAGMVAVLEVCFMLGQRYLIIHACKTAFGEAMTEEKDKFITLIVFQYDSRNTEDPVPVTECMEWGNQYYLTLEDSTRFRLDSIFQEKLYQKDIPVLTAVGCRMGEQYIQGSSLLAHPDYLAITEKTWRTSLKGKPDLTLKASVHIPVVLLLHRWYTYLLLLLGAIGWLYLVRRKTADLPVHQDLTEEISGEEIVPGYYWNDRQRKLFHEGLAIELKGMSLLYFRAFIRNSDFSLSYGQIAEIHQAGKVENSVVKTRAYQIIKQLKVSLKELDVEVKSIREVGYQLHFSEASVSSSK